MIGRCAVVQETSTHSLLPHRQLYQNVCAQFVHSLVHSLFNAAAGRTYAVQHVVRHNSMMVNVKIMGHSVILSSWGPHLIRVQGML